MQLNVAKWGNSLAVRLPSHIAKGSRLEEGATLEVEVQEDGTLILRPTRKRIKLSDLLQDLPEREGNAEIDWGAPKGEEAW